MQANEKTRDLELKVTQLAQARETEARLVAAASAELEAGIVSLGEVLQLCTSCSAGLDLQNSRGDTPPTLNPTP